MHDSGTYLYIGSPCTVRNEQDNILNLKSAPLGMVFLATNNPQFITL